MAKRTRSWAEKDAETRQLREEIRQLVTKWKLPLPWGPYRAAPVTCFKCSARIVVYTWVGHRIRGEVPPPKPRPRTVRLKTTRQSGGQKYWVNTCPKCRVPQGDNYLYLEAPRPFRWTWKNPLPSVPGGPLPWEPPEPDSNEHGFYSPFARWFP